jgi:hypothetical protein
MIYDTSVSWTTVLNTNARGAKMKSEYDPFKSETNQPINHAIWNPQTNEEDRIHE